MDLIILFLNFINSIFSFKILGMDLYTWLITITIVTLMFSIIKAMTNSKTKK